MCLAFCDFVISLSNDGNFVSFSSLLVLAASLLCDIKIYDIQ